MYERLIELMKYRRHLETSELADLLIANGVTTVVMCKDCENCSDCTPDGWHWCSEHERGLLMDDDFCSFGLRKGGEE